MADYWAIVDVSGMAYRSLAVMGNLQNQGVATGVVYGVAIALQGLADQYDTQNIVAVFDGGHAMRSHLWPQYKQSRKAKREKATPVEQQARADLTQQLQALRVSLLPSTGMRNILWADGFEADDLIASAVQAVPTEDGAVVLSADQDLWQCIRPGVAWRSTNNAAKVGYMSYRQFTELHRMEPFLWADVKAWAGCATDDIVGLDGIGETWAARWVRGEVPSTSTKYAQFLQNIEIYNRNINLTRLPAKGCTPVVLHQQVAPVDWNPLLRAIGAKTNGKAAGIQTRQGFGFSGTV
jgi:5'-3' exonuclease